MAPYDPPNTHYSQFDVSEYTEDEIFGLIGKMGKRFYWLTRLLSLDYLWYDRKRRVIEVWGPYFTHYNNQAEHIIKCELDFYKLKSNENKTKCINKNVEETIQAC